MNLHLQHYPENAKRLFKLSLPIFISQLAVSGMGLADIIMAGLVSDADVSAIAVANSIYLPLFLFVLGTLNAITPTVSYLNGSNQRHLIAHQIRQGGWIIAAFCTPMILVFLNSGLILDAMETPAEFSLKAQHYLLSLCFGIIPALLSINLRCLNDGLSNPKPAMIITFIGLLLNIPLNYIFIFGHLGAPELGAVGCGVATAIVNWLMLFMMIHYSKTTGSQKDIKLFEKWIELPNKATLIKLFKLGLPIGFAMFTEIVMFSASSLILSPLGAQVVASHQVTLQTSSIFFMVPLAFSIASTIVVGQTLGQGEVNKAKYLSFHAILTCTVMAFVMGLIILLLKDAIPHLFTSDPTSIAIASGLLIFAAIYQIPDAIQAVCNGILRGYKHTKPVLYTTMFCYWVVGLPLATILSRTDWLGKPMAAQGFWLVFCISLTIAAALLFYNMRRIQAVPAQDLLTRLDSIK
ncbi:MATE family efflux transporter [Pasteurellaceae bacterium 15-036681]|nr:MATE family efflux transporter [Pasteurellaceae bacterium 15-036681]